MIDFEIKKAIADKLSVSLPTTSEEEKKQALEMLDELGYNNPPESFHVTNKYNTFPRGNVGIYKPETVDGEVVYNRDIDFIHRWTFFADMPKIPAKKDKKRIVFLGESVARGFLLDPDYTPAFVLNKLINANSSKDKFEVIDLAETNINMREIKNRFTQCLDLQPDLVVFLAGNNWYEDCIFEIIDNKETLNTINNAINQANNIGQIKPELENVLESLIIGFMTSVSQTMKEYGFPVIMAIPEFNLMDCRSTPGERRATYLSGDGIKKWSEAHKMAQKAQNQGELKQLEVLAQTMIDIDPSHPLGYEMLADVKIEQQDYDAAREFFELGRDTAIFNRSNSRPRTFQVIRNTILEYAPKFGIKTLDVPAVFKRYLNGKIPGKELFLDYCHLSAEGIQAAIEPLADLVLEHTGNENKDVLKASNIKPSKLTLGMGYFYAAIHNEHWGQSYILHKHHCIKAVEASKDIAKIMVYYCDMISRNISNNLTKSLELILIANTKADRYGHALSHPRDLKLMEIDLVNAMVDALEEKGVNLAKFVKELRKKEHGVEGKTIDLLNPFYHATSFDGLQGVRPAFFQAKNTISRFFIVADKGVSVDLSISLRIPSSEVTVDPVEFWFNGFKVAAIDTLSNWVNHELTISGEHCKDGINELLIFWPVPETVDGPVNHEIKDAKSFLNSIYYVFGEISQFKATGVKESINLSEPLESLST